MRSFHAHARKGVVALGLATVALVGCGAHESSDVGSDVETVAGAAREAQKLGTQVSRIRAFVCAPGQYMEDKMVELGGPVAIVDTLTKAAERAELPEVKKSLDEVKKMLDVRTAVHAEILRTLVETKSLTAAFKSLTTRAIQFPATMAAKATGLIQQGGATGAATKVALWAGAYWGACKILQTTAVAADWGLQSTINASEKSRMDEFFNQKCAFFQANPHVVAGTWPEWCPRSEGSSRTVTSSDGRTVNVPRCEQMRVRADHVAQGCSDQYLSEAVGKVGSGMSVYRLRTVLHGNGVVAMNVRVQEGAMAGQDIWVNGANLEINPASCQ